MFDPNNEENNPAAEQEKFEDANKRNEEEDGGHYNCDSVRNYMRSLEAHSEYADDVLGFNNDGTYKFKTDLDPQRERNAART